MFGTVSRLLSPSGAAPINLGARRSSSFCLVGSHKITLASLGQSKFPLDKVTKGFIKSVLCYFYHWNLTGVGCKMSQYLPTNQFKNIYILTFNVLKGETFIQSWNTMSRFITFIDFISTFMAVFGPDTGDHWWRFLSVPLLSVSLFPSDEIWRQSQEVAGRWISAKGLSFFYLLVMSRETNLFHEALPVLSCFSMDLFLKSSSSVRSTDH